MGLLGRSEDRRRARRSRHGARGPKARQRRPSAVRNTRRSPPVLVAASRLLQKTGFVLIVFTDPAPRMERQRSALSRRFEERLMGYRQVIQVAEGILQLRQRGDEFRAVGLRMTTEGLCKELRRIAQLLCFDPGAVSRLGVEGTHVLCGLAQ